MACRPYVPGWVTFTHMMFGSETFSTRPAKSWARAEEDNRISDKSNAARRGAEAAGDPGHALSR